jgi:hypothetical protein
MTDLSAIKEEESGQNRKTLTSFNDSLTIGQPVVLENNGTIRRVIGSNVGASIGSGFTSTGGRVNGHAAVYDPNTNQTIHFWQNFNASRRGQVNLITALGTSFVALGNVGPLEPYDISIGYDESAQKVVLGWSDAQNSYYFYLMVGTVSSGSISWGTPTVVISSQGYFSRMKYIPPAGRLMLITGDTSYPGSWPMCSYINISGTTPSLAQKNVLEGVSTQGVDIDYSESNNAIIFSWYDTSNQAGRIRAAIVGSGNALSFGATQTFWNDSTEYISHAYDATNNRIISVFRPSNSYSRYGSYVLSSISGNTVTPSGTRVVYHSAISNENMIRYSNFSGKLYCVFQENPSNDARFFYGSAPATGTNLTGFSSGITDSSADTFFQTLAVIEPYNKLIHIYAYNTNRYGRARYVNPLYVSSNNSRYVGIARLNTATYAPNVIDLMGGISDKFSGLTIKADYYIDSYGNVSTNSSGIKIGRAITSTTINLLDSNK